MKWIIGIFIFAVVMAILTFTEILISGIAIVFRILLYFSIGALIIALIAKFSRRA